MSLRCYFIAALFLMSGGAAHAQPVLDCPLRDQPFSIDSPLLDVLLRPEARAAVDAASPGAWERIPARWQGTIAPSFAAIVTLRGLSGMMQLSDADLAQADAALRALRVTGADRAARCARYDAERPPLTLPAGAPRILLFEKMTGYRDGPSVDAARAAFMAIAARNGWTIALTDRGGAIDPAVLRNVDAVIWNNVSGDVLTVRQRRVLRRYMENGGGFVAVHGAGGDPAYFWDWYVETLIGARFIGHPANPQFQPARVELRQTRSAIGAALEPSWTMTDEWYSFAANPQSSGATIIATLDEFSYSPVGARGRDLRMGEHPIIWNKCVGSGRAFYSAIGHLPETYSEPHYANVLEQGLRWAIGLGETQCAGGREILQER